MAEIAAVIYFTLLLGCSLLWCWCAITLEREDIDGIDLD